MFSYFLYAVCIHTIQRNYITDKLNRPSKLQRGRIMAFNVMMQCSEGKIEGTDLFITVSYTQPYDGYTLRSSLLSLLNIIIVLRTHYEILFEGFVVYLI